MEELNLLREDLAESIDAATFLLDDRLYTEKSYLALVTAIGCAKAALAREEEEPTVLADALHSLHSAVDAMELREEVPVEQKDSGKKKNLTPVLVAGAFFGGLLLGKYVTKKHRRTKKK